MKAQVAAVSSLPYQHQSFDAIWCANVFQHLTHEALALTLHEFKRVLKPGGVLSVKDADLSAVLLGSDASVQRNFVREAFAVLIGKNA